MLEKKLNQYGQEQIIDNFDYIIKIGDKFLQVRLIQTKKWKERHLERGEFCKPLPRAKFVKDPSQIHYVISRDYLIKLKDMALNRLRNENKK